MDPSKIVPVAVIRKIKSGEIIVFLIFLDCNTCFRLYWWLMDDGILMNFMNSKKGVAEIVFVG
jgi:hypothetical protein